MRKPAPKRRPFTEIEKLHMSYKAKLRIKTALIDTLTAKVERLEISVRQLSTNYVNSRAYKRDLRIALIREYRRYGGTKSYREMAALDMDGIRIAIRELLPAVGLQFSRRTPHLDENPDIHDLAGS